MSICDIVIFSNPVQYTGGGPVKTIRMILWFSSMSFCLVFLLISMMSVVSIPATPDSLSNAQQYIEPMCFLVASIGLSLTPIRVIRHQIRYLLAFGSTALITLYYVLMLGFGDTYTNHPNSSLCQMDTWIIITLVILISYAVALFKADFARETKEQSEELSPSDPLLDPLMNGRNHASAKGSNEEIEVKISGSSVGNPAKHWRRTV